MKTSIVFVDWGRTLSERSFWDMNPVLYEKAQAHIFKNNNELMREWMLGKKRSEDISQLLSEISGTDYQTVWSELVRGCQDTKLCTETLNILRRIRTKSLTVLATDNMDCFERFTSPALGMSDYFEDILNSSITGRMKNDENGLTFREYAEARQVPLSCCYLVDDSEDTCNLFETLGGRSFRTTGEANTVECLRAIEMDLSDRFE